MVNVKAKISRQVYTRLEYRVHTFHCGAVFDKAAEDSTTSLPGHHPVQ